MSRDRVGELAVLLQGGGSQVLVCHDLDRLCNSGRPPDGNGLLDHERVSLSSLFRHQGLEEIELADASHIGAFAVERRCTGNMSTGSFRPL
jgi:hypothetical protein